LQKRRQKCYRDIQRRNQVTVMNSSYINCCNVYKIWGFHCSDYEECRLQGYINPVRTSLATRTQWMNVVVTGVNILMRYAAIWVHAVSG
jgi:hypothetical protein